MIEGFWVMKIQPPPLTTGGVVCLIAGKIFGGDNGFTWVGGYTMSGEILQARVLVQNFDPDIKSVLGMEGDYEMHFSGRLDGSVVLGTAMVAGQPQHSLAIRLERKVDVLVSDRRV